MAKMNEDLKKVIGRVRTAQRSLQSFFKSQDWVEEARKYAERQGKEVRKLFSSDLTKVKSFLEKERRELEKLQKQLPSEVEKLRTFVQGQRRELKKLLVRVGKVKADEKTKAPRRSRSTKKTQSSST
jgi:hypothetical protein